MASFLSRRLLQAVPLLLGVTLISFVLMHLAPGGPTALLLDPKLRAEDAERMRQALGLDRPILEQYLVWLGRLSRGDLGRSFINGQPVLEIIGARIPNTLLLMGTAMILTYLIAILLGVLSAVRSHSRFDTAVTVGSFLAMAAPVFWLGLMAQLFFGVRLGWLPTAGMTSATGPGGLGDLGAHMVLPVLTMTLVSLAGYTRYVRGSVLEALAQDYIRTARAKGLAERVVLFKHALRNALIPAITLFGLDLPALLGGAVVTETVFAWPGLGRLFFEKAFQRDYPVLMGLVIIGSCLTILGNLLADVLYALADPRVRLE